MKVLLCFYVTFSTFILNSEQEAAGRKHKEQSFCSCIGTNGEMWTAAVKEPYITQPLQNKKSCFLTVLWQLPVCFQAASLVCVVLEDDVSFVILKQTCSFEPLLIPKYTKKRDSDLTKTGTDDYKPDRSENV